MSVDKNTLIGYAIIAFILTMGHAMVQGAEWFDPSTPAKDYTLITSDFVTGQQDRVERDGMTVSDSASLEQPLLIKDTDCGSYAVSREISYSGAHVQMPFSI